VVARVTNQSVIDFTKENLIKVPNEDVLHKFIFESQNVRGEIVTLGPSWQTLLKRRTYPQVMVEVLGELSVAALLLSATIKIDGTLALQYRGSTGIQLLVAEVFNTNLFRSMAKWDESLDAQSNEPNLLREGSLAVTITQENLKQSYQGIVDTQQQTVQEALAHYMAQSEQIPTRLWLAANAQNAAGLMIQKIPGVPDQDADAWNRISQLASTVSNNELLELAPQQLLRRLFHEETIRLFAPNQIEFSCKCSESRTTNMLRSLGEEEVREILDEKASVDITCDFCGKNYIYSEAGVDRIFSESSLN